jgi:uncharacterized protein YjlB
MQPACSRPARPFRPAWPRRLPGKDRKDPKVPSERKAQPATGVRPARPARRDTSVPKAHRANREPKDQRVLPASAANPGVELNSGSARFSRRPVYRSNRSIPRTLARSSMSLLENIKKIAGKATGRGRPSEDDLAALVRHRKAHRFRFKDDGVIPNHPKWPLLVYRSALRLPNSLDPAAVLADLFESNGWGDSWRDGIYDYVHYHSRIHEVLGIARGNARVQFGGPQGRTLALKAGDVAILPAGTGHQCLAASKDFLVVGAYPASGTYDECRTSSKERERALTTIPKVGRPRKDPVYGKEGPLLQAWRRIKRAKRVSARR